MQLNKFSDYGLRILMYLAVTDEHRVPAAKIAGVFDISEHHVAKVASALAKGGFILSGRGRTGGLALARDAASVSVGEVARYLAGDVPVVECFSKDHGGCVALSACGLRDPLAEAQEAFFACLDAYTLNDIVSARGKLRALLGA